MRNVHTLEYYPAMKCSAILSRVATWMELQIFMINELRRAQKDLYLESQIEQNGGLRARAGCAERIGWMMG
jgi:hypothetical protein